MMIPQRCFTCGKPIGDKYEEFYIRTLPAEKGGKGEDTAKVLTELGLDRYCCRRMFLSHVNLVDEILPYPRF